jgi:hypothetical protein
VIGRSAARSRDNYVGAQTQQVTDAVNKEPLKAYDSEVYLHVETTGMQRHTVVLITVLRDVTTGLVNRRSIHRSR